MPGARPAHHRQDRTHRRTRRVHVLDRRPVRRYEQTSTIAAVAAFPVFAWEMSLAGWMIAKGFKPGQAVDRASRQVDLGSRVAAVPTISVGEAFGNQATQGPVSRTAWTGGCDPLAGRTAMDANGP